MFHQYFPHVIIYQNSLISTLPENQQHNFSRRRREKNSRGPSPLNFYFSLQKTNFCFKMYRAAFNRLSSASRIGYGSMVNHMPAATYAKVKLVAESSQSDLDRFSSNFDLNCCQFLAKNRQFDCIMIHMQSY